MLFHGTTHQTSVVKHSTEPTWNASFAFDAAAAVAAAKSGQVGAELLALQFEVWHKDTFLGQAEEFLGQAKVRIRWVTWCGFSDIRA